MNIKYKREANEEEDDFDDMSDPMDDYHPEAPKLITSLSKDGKILTLHLNGDVCDKEMNDLINAVQMANAYSGTGEFTQDEPSGYEYVEQINLFISSRGGSLKPMNQLLTAIDTSRIPVRTIGWGELASAAVVLMMAGHERLVSEHAMFMTHNASCANPMMSHVEDRTGEHMRKVLSNHMLDLFVKYTKQDVKYIKKHLLKTDRSDSHFMGLKAIEHGIADLQYTHSGQLNVILPMRQQG